VSVEIYLSIRGVTGNSYSMLEIIPTVVGNKTTVLIHFVK